jgi:neutral ceramidase
MKTAARCLSLLFTSSLSLLFSGCEHTGPSDPGLKIGAAEIDITPPVGHRMAGYFDERLATGVHDPLKAKAIVMKQGDEQIALVFCDLVGLSLNVTTNARAQVSDKTGIPVSHIMMCATHSHTGPLFDDTRRHYFHETALAKSGTDPQEKIYYPDFLTERLVKVVVQAQAKLGTASLAAGIAKQEEMTFNRRYWMKDGKVRFNPGQLNPNIVRPAGPTDPEVGILMARKPDSDKPFAGVTVFAMHCDTVGGSKYSADYPFFLQETLRGAFGAHFISAFAAGTCGDLNHINVNKKEPFKGFDMANHLGSTLGQTVLSAAGNLRTIANPSLKVADAPIEVPLQEPTPEQLADAHSKITKLGDTNTDFTVKVVAVKMLDLERKQNPYPMEVQVFRLDGDTAIVCLPCEIFVELGLAIKQASPFKTTMVMSICNDRPSYVPTKKAFTEGSYEVTNARVKPGAGEKLVETAVKLLNEAKN